MTAKSAISFYGRANSMANQSGVTS